MGDWTTGIPGIMKHKAGQIISNYELVSPLGEGGFGEVWLARHADLGTECALKIPTDLDLVRQLRQEARIQHSLEHPNIVRTLDLNTRHDPPYFVMEVMSGGDLRQRLKAEGSLPVDEALMVLRQILIALVHAHAAGVVHRDMKPENALLDGDGGVKIGDFGLGRVQAEVTQSLLLSGSMQTMEGNSISGSLGYMSPEQVRGEDPDPRDDIYALGVMGCELLTGQRPTGSILRIFKRQGIDQGLAEVFESACDELEFRYASAAQMLEALDGGGDPAEAAQVEARRIDEEREPQDAEREEAARVREEARKKLEAEARARAEREWLDARTPQVVASRERPWENSLEMKFVPVPGTEVLFCIWETGLQDYEAYAKAATGVDDSWRRPGFEQGRDHPVVYVSWDDAQGFCKWLTEKERKAGLIPAAASYRLPKDLEWSCAVGLPKESGNTPEERHLKIEDHYPWGSEWPPPRGAGNYGKIVLKTGFLGIGRETYHCGFSDTSPVGSFAANRNGLYDLGGNVWEWCEDFYDGKSGSLVLRGASWLNGRQYHLLSSYRYGNAPGGRGSRYGFRCVLVGGGGSPA
jgi:serine/threonine protein kinase